MRFIKNEFIKFCFLFLLFASANIDAQIHSSTSAFPTYTGLSMTGYQGWFSTPTDGARNNWTHYNGSSGFAPGSASIEYWPDMRETDPDERYITDFVFDDGSPAYVFSSAHPKTVNRHFQWMKEYGIDGALVQRFSSSIPIRRSTNNRVLRNVLAAAKQNNRAFAVMYDVSGRSVKVDGVISAEKRKEEVNRILDDWEDLVVNLKLTSGGDNQPYLYHNGKPLVVIWGAGFTGRDYDIQYFIDMVDSLQNNPVYGGCSIMLGVPTNWRTADRDCISGAEWNKLIELIKRIDIVEPWHTSRFGRNAMDTDFKYRVQNDITWCKQNGIDYVPTISPGIREKILHGNNYEISREGGYYFWDMAKAALEAGSEMLYLGMYDEVDEGTQYHKINNNPPFYSNNLNFATYGNNPEDHYLWLAGEATRALRGEFTMSSTYRTRADNNDFQSEINFVDNDPNYKMYLSKLAGGRRVYFADPYKVPDGAPTIGTKRDHNLFTNELIDSATFSEEQRAKYIRFVEVDENDNILSFKAPVGAYNYTQIPYTTGFEEGIIDQKYWTTTYENTMGNVEVVDSLSPNSGKWHLTLASDSSTYSTNSADLHIDLDGVFTDILFSFSLKTFGNEFSAEDGIYFSNDAGITFEKVFNFESTSNYTDFILNINEIVDSVGLSLSNKFIIRFQHTSNNPIIQSGIAIDDIKILYSDIKSGFIQFIDSDENTQGEWNGKYGIDGQFIIGKETNLPDYASVSWDPNSEPIVWAESSSEIRGLKYSADSTILAAQYSETENHPWWFTIDVGEFEKQVSIYFLDGDNQNRKFILNVVDKATGDKYDVQTLQNFENGKWLTWKIRGKVKFVMDLLEGPSAVVSGIFFAPSSPTEIEVINSLTFDGIDDFVDCGRDESIQVSGTEITLESWFKINNTKPATYQSTILAMDHNESDNDVGFFLRANGNGQINWGFGDGKWHEIKSEDDIQLFELDTWNHVAGVYGDSTQKIYLNGNLVVSKDSVYAEIMSTPTENLLIGSAPSSSNRVISASLSEVRIWNVARTNSEIKEFSTKRITGLESGLAAYWPLTEGEGQIVEDKGSNNNEGILGGTTEEDNFDPSWTEEEPAVKMIDILADYNGSFEDNLTYWRFYEVPNNLGSKIEIINGDIIHGANAVKITYVEPDETLGDRSLDNWDSNMPLEPGAAYYANFWAKTDSIGTGKLRVTYGFFDADRKVLSEASQFFDLTTEYQKYELSFSAPEGTEKGWLSFRWKDLDNNFLPGVIYIDHVQLLTEDKTVNIEDIIRSIPDKYELSQNYPNPFNPTTTIEYSLPENSKIEIGIYNILGQKVAELVNEEMNAGSYNVKWNAQNFACGIYIISMKTNSTLITKKMTLLK